MWFRKWRKNRNLKRFRPIAVLSGQHIAPSFHGVVLKSKIIIKQQKTSTIQKQELHKHFHHAMSMYTTMNQTIIQLAPMANSTQLLKQYKTTITKSFPKKTLQFKTIKTAIQNIAQEQLLEEKRYYQYHPAKAKELAFSYMKHIDTRNLIHRYVISSQNKNNPQLHTIHASILKRKISSYKLHEMMTPIMKEHVTNYVHKQNTREKEHEKQSTQKEIITQKEEMTYRIETIRMKQLVREVYMEVEKKLRYEQYRKGRK